MTTTRLRREVTLAGLAVSHPDELMIGGRWVPSIDGATMAVISPSDGMVVADVVAPGVEDADAALDAAVTAFGGAWPSMLVSERVAYCRRFCQLLEQRSDEMGLIWAMEAGVPVKWSRTLHRYAAVTAWRTVLDAAEDALAATVRDTPVGRVRIERQPVGPTVAVMPYNGPLPTIGSKVIPALVAGSTVVVKAAPETALMMRIVAQCAVDAGLPPGVLSFLAGDVDVSRRLVNDPRVEMISFTGGGRAASEILRQTSEHLVRTVFELGGKSPGIVLDDADLDRVLRPLVAGAMSGTGQVCATLSRILVSDRRYDEVVEKMSAAYGALRIGDPLSSDTEHGPLVNETARTRTATMVDQAVRVGASIVCGGKPPEELVTGWYYEPTLLVDAAEDSDIVRREVFGPVTVVQRYTDLEDAIRLANDTDYGLAASVFTTDENEGLRVASRIRAGSVALNTFGPTTAAPFGGVKKSGWGRECGPEGIQEFSETKQILLG